MFKNFLNKFHKIVKRVTKTLPICPSCKNKKNLFETQQLQKQLKNYFSDNPELVKLLYKSNIDNAYNYFSSCSNRWACDECLKIDKAIKANYLEQMYCIWQPHMAYVDQERECRTCDLKFTFTKHEQKFWYEELRFWVTSDAVNCKKCRIDKRDRKERISQAQKEISEFLPNFDKWNVEHLKRVIHLYELTESHKKVKQYQIALNKLSATKKF